MEWKGVSLLLITTNLNKQQEPDVKRTDRSLNISLSLLLDDNVRKHHEEVVNLVENKRKV